MSIAHPTQFVRGAWAAEPINVKIRDLLLGALTVSSGAIDAISFLALGKVFSAFMTGNIAFLGLRLAGASSPGPLRSFHRCYPLGLASMSRLASSINPEMDSGPSA